MLDVDGVVFVPDLGGVGKSFLKSKSGADSRTEVDLIDSKGTLACCIHCQANIRKKTVAIITNTKIRTNRLVPLVRNLKSLQLNFILNGPYTSIG